MPLNYATNGRRDTLGGIHFLTIHYSSRKASEDKAYLRVNVCATGRSSLNHCKDQSSVSSVWLVPGLGLPVRFAPSLCGFAIRLHCEFA